MLFGLYIHFPFCKKKCPYCNFSSIIADEGLIKRYIEALIIESDQRLTQQPLGYPQTIYIGGGTPSIVPAHDIKKTVKRFLPDTPIEFTVEANPESITTSWLDGMLESGASRISIGFQSLDDRILHNLGRIHTAKQAISSFDLSRSAGFSNISIDLMFGVPGQTIEIFEQTLEEALAQKPDHISCYSLGIEEDSEYYVFAQKGEIEIPDPDETAEMYLLMVEKLENSGLFRYELSNFSREGSECQHNRAYWDFTPYVGIGASAHSFDGTIRRWNEADPEIYTDRIFTKNDAMADSEILDENKRGIETIMLALRTIEGLAVEKFLTLSLESKLLLESKIDMFTESGFVEKSKNGNIRLTSRGAVIANEIITDILADIY